MNSEEQNYWRGYIDARVEDLGKTRTHYPSHEAKLAYREKLKEMFGLTK